MKLSAPTQMAFIIAVILAILALAGYFGVIAAIAPHSFWLMTVAFAVLTAACLFKGI